MKLKSKICKFFFKESKLFVCWLIFRGYCYGVRKSEVTSFIQREMKKKKQFNNLKEPNLCNLLCALSLGTVVVLICHVENALWFAVSQGPVVRRSIRANLLSFAQKHFLRYFSPIL